MDGISPKEIELLTQGVVDPVVGREMGTNSVNHRLYKLRSRM